MAVASESSPKPQRLLFCWFNQPHQQKAVREFLDEQEISFVGLYADANYLEDSADFFLASETVERDCHFPDIEHRYVPSREIIENLRSTEATVLKMMDRNFSCLLKPAQYEFRKRLYYSQLCMAYGLLMQHKFDRVIFSNVPHFSFDYILYDLCRELGIEVSFFFQLQVKDSFLHAHDIERLYDDLKPDEAAPSHTADFDQLPKHLKAENEVRSGKETPFYMKSSYVPVHPQQGLRGAKEKESFLARCWFTFLGWNEYRKIAKPIPNLDEDYIFFPLHMQPEATTSPMGGVHVEQYLPILTLARALPAGIKVLVKEHPRQERIYRSLDFYQMLAEEENIAFVHENFDHFELLENCKAAATISGTVGWEALFLKKPAILFGETFYQHAPGVARITCEGDIENAVAALQDQTTSNANPQALTAFLAHLGENSYTGCINAEYFASSLFEEKHHIEAVKSALEDALHAADPNPDTVSTEP